MKPVVEVAKELGIPPDSLNLYGKWKAKVPFEVAKRLSGSRRGKLILVTAMTPTPLGEGKTVTAIGLGMGLSKLGHQSVVCLRQPSLGPVFGIKGGAAGGGKSTVEPMQSINMGFTGDINAIGVAHNLLAAVIDNHLFQGNELGIDWRTINWPRTMDMNDRSLRGTVIGLGGKTNGIPRQDGFIITAASEVMAILCLSRDYADLKERLGRITIGYTRDGKPIHATDLKVVGAMAAVLKEAMEPNLVQTVEGTPALIHGGPFANIAHGTASLISIQLGLSLADYCVVEAGFASDLGAEKFVDIACRVGELNVDAAMIVASVRALRYHGGATKAELNQPNPDAVRKGLGNLGKHIENVRTLGPMPIVALNKFRDDTEEEIRLVERFCKDQGIPFATSTAYEEGGQGSVELARQAADAAKRGQRSRPLYPLEAPIEQKVEAIARDIYGAVGVDYSQDAKKDLQRLNSLGLVNQPVCVAKTPLSLTDDSNKIGRPREFNVLVRRVHAATGAGFNITLMGDIVLMPGLPKVPAAENIKLNDEGMITGVF
ncbi:MAG TPA: formate--tetrahydrofolate ligase [Candidatus Acidoferrales bacterium]|nr:formate--tetrahydrofolate ligase [Candidatus Acidoferrales bacterium]